MLLPFVSVLLLLLLPPLVLLLLLLLVLLLLMLALFHCCCWSSLDVVAPALANVAVAAFACSSAHFDFTAVLRASTSHSAPCTHTRRLQTR
jgi:hypothetical protein